MRSLFLKIFLYFWLALALFMVLAILVTIALSPPGRHAKFQSLGAEALTESVNAYHNGGERAAFQYLQNFQHDHMVWVFVYDASGREISGRLAPPWIEEAHRTGKAQARGWLDHVTPARTYVQSLTIGGEPYVEVLESHPEPHVFIGPHDIPVIGITIAVISSGLLCYLLAWSLTKPLTRLRRATQRLAQGDLSARAGAPLAHHRDELAELTRDFDRMAERIEQLVETQSRLLKDVSHELRSPLARLSVALGLARHRSSPDSQSALDRIELETERLNQLIQRLLTISRLEAGSDAIRKTNLELRDLVDAVARDAEYEEPGRTFVVEFDPDSGYLVRADPELLRSAIENVVRNAARYTAAGTTVKIQLEHQSRPGNEEIVVRVLDCGPGVPEDELEKIFQPFYRIDDARNRQTGGAGLGLSIADRAVRLHGGRVRASNRVEGGLEVEIRIPAAPASPVGAVYA